MEAFTRRPRGYQKEPFWKGQSDTVHSLVDALVDNGAWKPTDIHEIGRILVLQPGQSIYSLPELATEVGASEKEVRTARKTLAALGFVEYWQAFGHPHGRTVYQVVQWWRFIEVGRAGIDEKADRMGVDRVESRRLNIEGSSRAGHGASKNNGLEVVASSIGQLTGSSRAAHGQANPRDDRARTYRAQSAEHTHAAGQDACVRAHEDSEPIAGPGTEERQPRLVSRAGEGGRLGSMVSGKRGQSWDELSAELMADLERLGHGGPNGGGHAAE